MTMIKIGERYINMDNVVHISPVSEQYAGKAGIVKIEFTGGQEWIEDHEAQALLNWLNCISADVVKMFEMDIAQAEISMSNDAEDRYNRKGW